jgi:hypothetical protein
MQICEKAAVVERIAASQQSFKDTSKAKKYQHRKDAIADKVNGLILARRAGVGSTGFQVQLLEGNQHAPVFTGTTMVLLVAVVVAMGWLVTNKHTGTTMVLLITGVVAMGWLMANERTGTTMVLLVMGMVAPTTMGWLVMNEHTAMWQVMDGMAAGHLLVVPGTIMGIRVGEEDPKMGQHLVEVVCPLVLQAVVMKLQLIGSICTVCVKRSNTTVKIPSRTVLEICLILMESSLMHFYEQSLLVLNNDWIVIQMRWHIHFILFYCITT